MKTPPLAATINAQALKLGMNPKLLAAVIHQESAGNTFAIRYEPDFYDRYVKNQKPLQGYVPSRCSLITEKNARATSFGLFQMMGQVARERGFRGEFLSELLDPETNIEYGSLFLKHLLDTNKTTEAALLRWNGGGNKNYAKEVLSHIDTGACFYLLSF